MNVYDFDKTIYSGDCTVDFYLFSLKRKPALLLYLPVQFFGFILYFLKKIDKTRLKEYFFYFLKSIDCEKYVNEFWILNKQKIYDWYIENQKTDDIIISASPYFLLIPICNQLGIKHLIASIVDKNSGRFLSENCYGAKKVERFKAEFGDCRIDNFYSDSLSDFPMTQIADNSFLIVKGKINEWNKGEVK